MSDTSFDAPAKRSSPRAEKVREPSKREPAANKNLRLIDALTALKRGDFARRLHTQDGVPRDVVEAFNALAQQLDGSTREFSRVAKVVGRDGDMTERVETHDWAGGWAVTLAGGS